MSVEKLRQLRDTWQANDPFQLAVDQAFDEIGFTESYVRGVIEGRSRTKKSKQLKDNVWGMMEFDWRSMRLIDSPVLQRLRRIHQLGLSYLTYSTAEHSRFSHSLGVAHVVTRFIEAIDKRASEPQEGELKFVRLQELRGIRPEYLIHAALLHDVGHLPFSHVSEKVLSNATDIFSVGQSTVADLLYDVGKVLGKGVPLAEILSLVVVLSRRFENFYCNAVLEGLDDTYNATLYLGCLITGLPPQPGFTALCDLISSASVDADKVDYVNRDALNCGIPVGVDVSRVFLRSGIVLATEDQIRKIGLKKSGSSEFVLVINSSGMDTIDEVLMARTALYQRVYFHAVTRTAERIFGASLLANAKSANPDPKLTDLMSLWGSDDAALLGSLVRSADTNTSKYAERIRLRHLPHKAYAFGPSLENLSYPIEDILPQIADESAYELRKAANTAVEALRDEKIWGDKSQNLEKSIADQAEIIRGQLPSSASNASLSAEDSDVLVVGTAHKDKRRHVQIMCQGEQLIAGRKYTNASEQQDAFELLKEIGFIMSEPAWRPLTFFAARDVLSRLETGPLKMGLTVAETSYPIHSWPRFLPDYRLSALKSGQSAGELQRLERSLRGTATFREKPWLAEPMDAEDTTVKAISERLRPFVGVHGWRVTPRTVAYFLSQFPPDLRDEMAMLLHNDLDVLDWQTISTSFSSLLNEIGGSFDLLPLTTTSGARVHETFKREASTPSGVQYNFRTNIGPEVLGTKNPIVFLDDNTSSGTQAAAQLLSLFAVPQDRWPVQCRNETGLLSAFTSEQLDQVRGRQIYLLLSVGTKRARDFVKQALADAGVVANVEIRFAKELQKTTGISEPLKAYLTEVGSALCAWHRYGSWTGKLSAAQIADCEKDALGYGNAGGMITTLQNVPSGALTALWQPGVFRGHPWMPLLIRSSRFEDLVVG